MFIGETILAVTALCSLPKKRSTANQNYTITTQIGTCFQIASGRTLGEEVMMDLQDIVGVREVSVKQSGAVYEVDVVLHELRFDVFEKVVQKELELFDRFPDLKFRFNIEPWIDVTESLHVS